MQRFQEGCLQKTKRKNGSQVWTFRWYDVTGEKRTYRKRVIRMVEEMPWRRDAERVLLQTRVNINAGVTTPETVTDLIAHYRKHELTPERKAFATIEGATVYLNNHIEPRRGKVRLSAVRTVEVETWLDGLKYAPGTRSKIRKIMSALFQPCHPI
jgi:hypothetical protein